VSFAVAVAGIIRAGQERHLLSWQAVSLNRGHWSYVDDSDLDSKSTFSMLGQLFALQSATSRGNRRY